MTKYRIKKRKWSSNVIEKLVGKTWSVFLAPTVKKQEGDEICEQLLTYFREVDL